MGKRVIRGNTYAQLQYQVDDEAGELARHRERQRERLERASARRQQDHRDSTPEPVPGRHHMDIQTDTYLEELTGRVTEFEAETQTDFLLDRPPTPLFMPCKQGLDCGTQIEDGELFEFDVEVEPILEVLVGKTLERAVTEVCEEEELSAMRAAQEHYLQLREQELIEVQRMEAAEERRQSEIGRRKEQAAARKEFDEAVVRKILSRNVARGYLAGLAPRCFDELIDSGVFYESDLVSVEGQFFPQLLGQVQKQVAALRKASATVSGGVSKHVADREQTLQKTQAFYEEQLDELEEAERRLRAERDEELRLKALEEQRIKEERERLEAGEAIDWLNVYTVGSYDAEAGTVALEAFEEGEDPVTVPEGELREGLAARFTEKENAEDGVTVPDIKVEVNVSERSVVRLLDPEALPPAEEGEENGEA